MFSRALSLAFFLICTNSLLLEAYSFPVQDSEAPDEAPASSVASSAGFVEECRRIQSFTVRVVSLDTPNASGSGVIIDRQGDIYTVLTAAHVLRGNRYGVIAPFEAETLSAQVIIRLDKVSQKDDLALLKFRSKKDFSIARLGVEVKSNQISYVAGFPQNEQPTVTSTGFACNQGKIATLLEEGPMERGYRLGYLTSTRPGMSGGPVVIKSEQALTVVGIHGVGSNPPLGGRYVYKSGIPVSISKQYMRQHSWGIPISAFLQEAPRSLATRLSATTMALGNLARPDSITYPNQAIKTTNYQLNTVFIEKDGAFLSTPSIYLHTSLFSSVVAIPTSFVKSGSYSFFNAPLFQKASISQSTLSNHVSPKREQ